MKDMLVIAAFIASIVLIATCSYLSLEASNSVSLGIKEGESHFKTITTSAAEVSSFAKRAEGHLFLYLTLHRKADSEKFPKRIGSLNEHVAILDTKIENAEARKILEEIKESSTELLPRGTKLIEFHDKSMKKTGVFNHEKYSDEIFELHDIFSKIRKLGVSLVSLEAQLEHELKAEIFEKVKNQQFNVLFLIAAFTIFLILLGCYLARTLQSLKKEITKRIQAENQAREEKNKLIEAQKNIKVLQGIIPICMHCKQIKDKKGYWDKLEKYITEHSEAAFSHGICEKCMEERYP